MMQKFLPQRAGMMILADQKKTALEQLAATDLLALASEQGSLLLRGFDLSMDNFFSFTETLGLKFMDYRGGAFERKEMGDPTLMTVTGHEKGFPIPLHGELYYQKEQPDFLCFFCKSKALLGGSTLVANARAVYESLPEETQTYLQTNPIKYSRRISAAEWPRVYKTQDQTLVKEFCDKLGMSSRFDDNGDLITEFVTEALHENAFLNNILPNYYLQKIGRKEGSVTTSSGDKIPDGIIKSIEKACKLNTVKVQMLPGDLLIVNNRAALHGRSAFIGKREIFLRMGSV